MSDSDSSSSSSSPQAQPPPPPPPPRTLSMLLPFLLGLARTTTGSRLNQIVVLDHAAQTVVVFEGHALDSLLRDLSGPLPASKASIDAMPKVQVTELGIDCAICLDGFQVGEEAREMPCKHRYHSDCIEKWLGVRGTCPVCRFSMPVDDREGKKNGGVDDDEDMEGGGEGRVVVVNLWISDGETMDVESGSGHGSGDSDSESQDEMMGGVHVSSTQDPSSEDFS